MSSIDDARKETDRALVSDESSTRDGIEEQWAKNLAVRRIDLGPPEILDRFVLGSLGQDGRSKQFELADMPDLEPEVDDMPALENYDAKDGRIRDLQEALTSTQTALAREKNRNRLIDIELASWIRECSFYLVLMICFLSYGYYMTDTQSIGLAACRQQATASERLILSIVDAIKPVFALRDDINVWGRGM